MNAFPYVPAPSTVPGRIVLWTHSAARKTLILVVMLIFMPLLVLLVFSIVDITSATGAPAVALLFATAYTAVLALFVYQTVRTFRSAVLLEGTALVERSVFTSRRCDLTQSVVTFGGYPMTSYVPIAGGGVLPVQSSRVMPALTAMDGRQAVRLNLQPPLAPWKLLALADAIVAGGQRQDPAAWQAAGILRQWASASAPGLF